MNEALVGACSNMSWIQFWGILIPLIGIFGFLYRELKDWRIETREEIKGIQEEIKHQALRSDKLYEACMKEFSNQSERTDKLYQMFIDLLKSKNFKTDP